MVKKPVHVTMIVLFAVMLSSTIFAQNTPEEFSTYMDHYILEKMTGNHIPGSVLVYIKDGRIFYKKGYGFADIESKTPVTSDKTVFRIGSVSKLFVGTAVMKLVEQGRLDLNQDINSYLKAFKVPTNNKRPVTLKHLLTHTAGFDDLVLNRSTLNKEDRMEFGQYLRQHIPDIFIESGEVTSYSNFGVNLAAFIVEEVSGTQFHRYVKENVLNPLLMKNSSYMPLPGLMKNKATPYLYKNGKYHVFPHDYMHDYASGALLSTGSDIANFMLMHLNKGQFNGKQILIKSTIDMMHRQQFTNYPSFPGMAISFIEGKINGKHVLWHNGWHAGFQTLLLIIPDYKSGFFVSFNSDDDAHGAHFHLDEAIRDRIMNKYYPGENKPYEKKSNETVITIPDSIEGWYRNNRFTRTKFTKLAVFLADSKVSILGDDTILYKKKKYNRINNLLFEPEDKKDQLAFEISENGIVKHMFLKSKPVKTWDRVPFYESSVFHLTLLGISGAFFLAAMILTPIIVYRKSKAGDKSNLYHIRLWKLKGAIASLNIVSMLVIAWVLLASAHISFKWEIPLLLNLILMIQPIIFVLWMILTGSTIVYWKQRQKQLWEIIFISFFIFACLLYFYFVVYWNLTGFGI